MKRGIRLMALGLAIAINGTALMAVNASMVGGAERELASSGILRAVPPQPTNEHMDHHANPNPSRRSGGGMARGADNVRYAGLPYIGGKD